MHYFLKFIFRIKLYMFRTVPLYIIRSFSLYTQQWYMSYSLRAGSGRSVLILLASCMTYTYTPNDGQRNCPKHEEFYSKNKFEKLVHLVGFIVRKKLNLLFEIQVQVIVECLMWVQPISKETVLTGQMATAFKPTFRWCWDMNSRHLIIVFRCLQRGQRSCSLGFNFRFTSRNMSTIRCLEKSGKDYLVTRRLIPVEWQPKLHTTAEI
jgi:hypothetical protein